MEKNVVTKAHMHNRISFILIAVFFCYLAIIFRLIDLSFVEKEDIADMIKANFTQANSTQSSKRADIIDRNGLLLASNVNSYSLSAQPRQIIDKPKVARQLAATMPSLGSEAAILAKLKSTRDFIWLKRHINPLEKQKIYNLGILGLSFEDEWRRFYPQRNLFAHALGFLDIDGRGLAGIELFNDEQLRQHPEQPLRLSLDVHVQHIVRDNLQKAMHLHGAKAGVGIVMDITNGELLSMVSMPDFDPNLKGVHSSDQLFNRASLAVSESGSVLKLLTVAMALNEGKIRVNDAFDVSQPLRLGRYTIHDYKGKGGQLSVPEILMYSSNLGVAQIIKRVGAVKQYFYAKKIGLLDKPQIELVELGRPLYPTWKKWRDEVYMTTISYGHGIAVTPINVISAVGTMVNGGYLLRPTLLHQPKIFSDSSETNMGANVIQAKFHKENAVYNKDQKNFEANKEKNRVFSRETSLIMRKIMRLIVKHGTGRFADVPGYLVGGKSGTAEVVSKGKYNKKLNIANFIGVFPINNPKFIVFVALDQAQANSINGGYTTGGMIAAPLAGQIIRDIAPLLNIVPSEEFSREVVALNLDFQPRYRKSDVFMANKSN